MKAVGICGSLRNQSYNYMLLKSAAEFIPAAVDFEIVSINTLGHYNEDLDGDSKPHEIAIFLDKIDKASVLLFATPEYNHGIPGVLKNAIDWASRPAFQSPLLHKPCGILTSSLNSVGGARAQADLKNVLLSTLSYIFPHNEYLLPNAQEKFDHNGKLIDPTALRRLKRYVEGLMEWSGK